MEESELRFNLFIVKGRDNQKRNVGILYKLSDGTLLKTYENYTVLDLVRFEGIVISKCEDTKLIATDYKIIEMPVTVEFQIQSDKCELLSDHKSAVIELGDEFSKEFKEVIEGLTIPVVISSRVNDGIILHENLLCDNTIAADNLPPQKAAVLLRLALLKSLDRKKLQDIFDRY